MINYRFDHTMMVVNPDKLARVVGSETLIVTGPARGMTSAVALTLYELDYFIGANLQMHNLEDQDMLRALPSREIFRRHLRYRKPFRAIVEKRNAAHSRWGFKLPRATHYISEMPELLRNPVFVLCTRNPVAVCRSVMKREPDVKGGLSAAYRNAKQWVPAMDYLMRSKAVPSLILDMDCVQRVPNVFIQEFSRALQLSGDFESIVKKISKPGYKRVKEREGVTMLRENGEVAPPIASI